MIEESWPFADPSRLPVGAPALEPGRFGLILADPPQAYTMRTKHGYDRSPEAHYRTMGAADIAALPVERLAGPHCLLVLWSTWPHLAQSMEVLRCWGFSYLTGGSWFKRTASGGLHMGTGHIQRSSCEPYLIGGIGRPRYVSKSERNAIETWADVEAGDVFPPDAIDDSINAQRREHSRKPDEMRAMLERLLPHARKVELFARRPWPGAEVWGDQCGGAAP